MYDLFILFDLISPSFCLIIDVVFIQIIALFSVFILFVCVKMFKSGCSISDVKHETAFVANVLVLEHFGKRNGKEILFGFEFSTEEILTLRGRSFGIKLSRVFIETVPETKLRLIYEKFLII